MTTPLDVDQLSQTLSAENPCGPDLSYDPLFGELERAAQGKAEQQFGDTVIPAEPPQWKVVRDKALLLCQRTKDLRVFVYVVQAELNLTGLPGYADALEVLRKVLADHWQHVHPELDPDDAHDPTLRLNTLRTLVSAPFLQELREVPLVRSRRLGQFCLRDIQVASGQAPAPANEEDAELPNLATIEAAFLDADGDELQSTLTAVGRALDSLQQLDSFLESTVQGAATPDFAPLRSILSTLQQTLNEQAARRGLGDFAADGAADGANAEAATGADDSIAAVTPAPAASVPQGIQRREDVIRMLDEICDYFRRHEPSSPVPILLQRAKNLVSKDFMEILRDLTPDAVSQAELFRGPSSE